MAVEIITTVLVAATATPPAGAYDLTDLVTVHDELSLPTTDTSNDAFLQRAITQASTVIANYCNRVFQVEALQDQAYIQQDPYPWQVPGGVYPLQLSRWPMAQTGVVAFTGATHGSMVIDGIVSTAGIVAGVLIFASDGSLPAGTVVITVNANSLVLSNASSSTTAGVSFTTGVQVIQTLSATTTQTLTYGQDYTIDAKNGWLIRLNSWTGVSEKWESEPVTVQYQAGYATVPTDLQDACLRLVTARFKARGRDPMLVSQSQPQTLGEQRYWVGATPGQRGAMAPEIQSIIDTYRVPVTA